MKRRQVFFGLVIACLIMSVATSCTTYESVKATALLGKNIDSHTNELNSFTEICRSAVKMKVKYLDCTTEAKQQADYQRAAKVISAYGVELEKLVGDQKDLNYATELSSIIKGFNSVDWNKLANDPTMQGNLLAPLKNIANLIVDTASKKALYRTVTRVDPYLQDLKRNATLDFANRASVLKNLNSEINEAIRTNAISCQHIVANPDSPECTDACDIKFILACRDFRSMKQEWNGYTKALFAFIDAHHNLDKGFSVNGILSDAETYQKVIDAVKAVYETTKKQ